MFRRPGAGRSKASADTQCQKCLKRGHYSYECKATAQERPYKSRPSRTQQLLNPKLQPKLTTDVPNELLGKKGIADEILKSKEAERRRSRSNSTSSVDSISTISTTGSPPRSPIRSQSLSRRKNGDHETRRREAVGKRRRRSGSVASRSLDGSHDGERRFRRRISPFSPDRRSRGRTRSRSASVGEPESSAEHGPGRSQNKNRYAQRSVRSHNRNDSQHRHGNSSRYSMSRSRSRPRSVDRRDSLGQRKTQKLVSEGGRDLSPERDAMSSRSHSPSGFDQTRDLSTHSRRKAVRQLPSPRDPADSRLKDHLGGSSSRAGLNIAQSRTVRKKRSLSPFSKRVALTRAMQDT